MKRLLTFLLVGLVTGVLSSKTVAFSQETTGEVKVELPEKGGATPELAMEPETQWVWGEVVSVDTQEKKVTVKYLDYETDQEKQLAVTIDDKTAYENIKSLDELKPLDTVSIDYVTSTDGKNLAKNISIEKPENVKEMREDTAEAPPRTSSEAPAQ